jgi:septal ring factor EnvC (AmiA/AmiB activator)
MRRYLFIVALLTLAICIVAGAAYADIPDRIRDQQQRINQGIRSGELTRSEADVLRDNLNWIKERFNRMTADGLLTPGERAKLDDMLERNNQMIYNKKHNARRLERW